MYNNLLKLLCFGAALVLCSCTKKTPNMITIEEMLRSHGVPTVLATDYKIDREAQLLTITLFGVNKRVSAEATNHLHAGQIVVFCTDPRFIRELGFHFDDVQASTQFSGSSMFSALLKDDTKLTIFRIAEDGKAELQYSDYVIVVYLEVGDKDHLVRVRPSRPAPAGSTVPPEPPK